MYMHGCGNHRTLWKKAQSAWPSQTHKFAFKTSYVGRIVLIIYTFFGVGVGSAAEAHTALTSPSNSRWTKYTHTTPHHGPDKLTVHPALRTYTQNNYKPKP